MFFGSKESSILSRNFQVSIYNNTAVWDGGQLSPSNIRVLHTEYCVPKLRENDPALDVGCWASFAYEVLAIYSGEFAP